MWACKSHYYSAGLSFYNFPYAFGQLFGTGVYAQYKAEGPSFVPKYNQLLRSCGSGMIADVAKSVGIDVHSVDFWRASLNVYVKQIDEFIALAFLSNRWTIVITYSFLCVKLSNTLSL